MSKDKIIKIVDGVSYTKDTPDKVISALNRARNCDSRIRVFYGNPETGKDWCEEHDVIGYVGLSMGPLKVPLLVPYRNSRGGPTILLSNVVRMTMDKVEIYRHPKYHIGILSAGPTASAKLLDQGYTHQVLRDGVNIANFKSEKKANNYIRFLKGEANTK